MLVLGSPGAKGNRPSPAPLIGWLSLPPCRDRPGERLLLTITRRPARVGGGLVPPCSQLLILGSAALT